jgi:hypothetical protein
MRWREVAMVFMALEDAMELIRMEYHELPGQALTVWQAQRLWNLSDQLCEHALRSLCARVSDGDFVRDVRAQARIASSTLTPSERTDEYASRRRRSTTRGRRSPFENDLVNTRKNVAARLLFIESAA